MKFWLLAITFISYLSFLTGCGPTSASYAFSDGTTVNTVSLPVGFLNTREITDIHEASTAHITVSDGTSAGKAFLDTINTTGTTASFIGAATVK